MVVDLGAGTGTFTLAVAPVCRKVVAVDVSPAMAAALRGRVEQLGLDNVTVVEGGFLSYQHDGAPADVIFTRNALHQLTDFWKAIALERAAGMLRPGGVLRLSDLVFDFEPAEAEERIDAWMSGAVTVAAIGWTAEESPNTCAVSSAPTAGCSKRCSTEPVSTSRNDRFAVPLTAPTPVLGVDAA